MNITIPPDFILYAAQFIAMLVVVVVLEYGNKRRFLASGKALWPVTWAVAQVGLIVLARLYLAPLTEGSAQDGAIAVWWMVFWSFVASLIPVGSWVALINHGQFTELMRRKND